MPADFTTVPLIERLADDLMQSLAGISQQAGYSCDLIVEGVNQGVGNQTETAKAVVVQESPRLREVSNDQVRYNWDVPFKIVCTVIATEGTNIPIRTRLHRVWSDVTYALMGTESAWTRGGNAIDTELLDVEYDDQSNTAHEGQVTITASVWYRHIRGNPSKP